MAIRDARDNPPLSKKLAVRAAQAQPRHRESVGDPDSERREIMGRLGRGVPHQPLA
jgi:hypothetical protein